MTLVMLYMFAFYLLYKGGRKMKCAIETEAAATKRLHDAEVMLKEAHQSLINAQTEWIKVRSIVQAEAKKNAERN